MPNFAMTPDDQMFPVYCIQCRKHIPRSESDFTKGYCESCKVQVDAQQQQAAQIKQQQDDILAQKKWLSGMKARGYTQSNAVCRFCGKGPIFTKQQVDSHGGTRAAGLLFGCCCFWPLLFLAAVPDRKGAIIAFCPNCSNEYTV